MGHLITAVKAVFRKLKPDQTVPFVAIHRISAAFALPVDFAPERYPGLVLLHVSEDPDRALVAYWRTRDHFRVYSPKLQHDLHFGAPDIRGSVSDLKRPKESFFASLSLKESILGAVALIGAIFALHGYFAVLFDPADLQVAFTEAQPLDTTPGATVTAGATVLNDSSEASARIREIKGYANSQDGKATIPLRSDLQSYPLLAAGTSTSFRLTCESPQPRTQNGPPEILYMNLEVGARTGLLRGTGTSKTKIARQLRIWNPEVGWAQPVKRNQSPTFLQLVVTLYTGKAYSDGVRGYVSITAPPGQIADLRVRDQDGGALHSPADETVTEHVEFHTPALDRYQQYPLAIDIAAGKALSAAQWQEIISTIQFGAS
ncbi:MAG TPA: hypothetical protein VHC72_06195 [Bryobacteraceae bacterium]|nr:hypothetical protein [Bryobacteraceae bacterium]